MNINIPEGFSKYLGPHLSVFNDDVLLYSASNFNCNEEFEDSEIEEEVMCQIEEEIAKELFDLQISDLSERRKKRFRLL